MTIKYRAWHKKEKRWVNHNEMLENVEVSATVLPPSICSLSHPDWAIQLSIEMRDKNGIEVFEGDICNLICLHEDSEETYIEKIIILDKCTLFVTDLEWVDLEVVGNVFQNFDILKDKDGNEW